MRSFRLPTREEVTEYLQAKWSAFLHFAYNRERSEYFGRTVSSWGKIGLFYLIFYGFIGGLFAVHLMLFACNLPPPDPGMRPRNFGRFAYPNFPNSPLNLLVIPRRIDYDGQSASMSRDDRKRFEKLISSAREVGVDPVCINSAISYGYANRQPCALLHVSKVFRWTPEAISKQYESRSFLDIQCYSDNLNRWNVSVRVSPPGLPLDYTNAPVIPPGLTSRTRRFPYTIQSPNYTVPVMSVVFDLTGLSLPAGQSTSFVINCGLNISTIPELPNNFSERAISELYEVPRSTVINMFLKN